MGQGAIAFAAELGEDVITIEENRDNAEDNNNILNIENESLRNALKHNLELSENEEIRLDMMKNITVLDLSGFNVTSFYELKYCENLEVLNISDSNVDVSEFSFIYDLPKLREIIARRVYIGDLRVFENMKSLERLDISENHIIDISPLYNLVSSGQLKSLNASNQLLSECCWRESVGEAIELPLLLKGINGNKLWMDTKFEGASYDNENNILKVMFDENTPIIVNVEFKDLAVFEGVDYNYSGVIDVYLEAEHNSEDNADEEVDKEATDLNTTIDNNAESTITTNTSSKDNNNNNKSNNKKNNSTTKVQKTGDVGLVSTIGISISSLIGLVVSRKRKKN